MTVWGGRHTSCAPSVEAKGRFLCFRGLGWEAKGKRRDGSPASLAWAEERGQGPFGRTAHFACTVCVQQGNFLTCCFFLETTKSDRINQISQQEKEGIERNQCQARSPK